MTRKSLAIAVGSLLVLSLIALAGPVVGAQSNGTPLSLSVSVSETSVSPGDELTVSATLTNDGSETVYGPSLEPGDLPGEFSFVDADTDGGTVRPSSGDIVWVSLDPGESVSPSITFEVGDDANGNYSVPVTAEDSSGSVTKNVSVSVEGTSNGVDVNENGAPSTDVDGDGLHEDVDGDGDFDILDVQVLFVDLTTDGDAVGEPVFDFNEDASVDIIDVQALFTELL